MTHNNVEVGMMSYEYKAKMIHFKMKKGKLYPSIWICESCEGAAVEKALVEKVFDKWGVANEEVGLGVNFTIDQLVEDATDWLTTEEMAVLKNQLMECIKKLDEYIEEK